MNRTDSHERACKIVALVNGGDTFTEVAKRFGMTRQHVSEIYHTFGTRKSPPTKPRTGIQAAKLGLPLSDWREFSKVGAIRAYNEQRRNAEMRGVGWEMTIYEWWGVWEKSGKWSQRGRAKGQYVMARAGDEGPYKLGNVRIATTGENMREAADVRRERCKKDTSDDVEDLHTFIMSGRLALFERDLSQ